MSLFEVYPLYNVSPEYGKGCYVYDKKHSKYLDLYGGHAVISIGHNHPTYTGDLTNQLKKIGFYSNYIINDLQTELSDKIIEQLKINTSYKAFFCSSGTEANEHALKLASYKTGKEKIIAFNNSFHGRSCAAIACTDNGNIHSKLSQQVNVSFLPFNNTRLLEEELSNNDVCAVIIESIQGVGGLNEPSTEFMKNLERLCEEHDAFLIADEVQSGFGRTGDFFAFQKHKIKPDIITMAKGMGNGFPVGGILVSAKIKAEHGLLGTTFGGNHLACTSSLSVLKVIQEEKLMENAKKMEKYFRRCASEIKDVKIKGRGLMLGLEFNFEAKKLREDLIYKKHIFTGGSANKNILRILPPLNIKEKHFDKLFEALGELL